MEQKTKYFFIGIGGISMSALAKYLHKQGHEIFGSDINKAINLPFANTNKEQVFENIKNADFVVFNNAIKPNNKELVFAKKMNKIILNRSELLAQISKEFEEVIAISGTHGKTTTTEMLAEIFIEANLKPTVHIGGVSNAFNSNILISEKKYFITEACEYGNSFLSLHPTASVILNEEPDHLDYFKNFKNIQIAFNQFAKQSEKVFALNSLKIPQAITFGKNGNFEAKKIRTTQSGFSFSVYKNNNFYFDFFLKSVLKKNIQNALSAIAVCDYFGIEKQTIFNALKNFKGVKRRLETYSKSPTIIFDYAHLPNEITQTIKSVKSFFKKKLTVVFQPHLFSRTKFFLEDFKNCFGGADKLILTKTYAARETPKDGISAKQLFDLIKEKQKNTLYFESATAAKKHIEKNCKNNEVILILGAGDVYEIFKN